MKMVTLLNEHQKSSDRPIIIIGAGGHASVVADMLCASGDNIIGVTDPMVSVGGNVINDINVIGTDDVFSKYPPESIMVAIGVGFLPGSNIRREVFQKFKNRNFSIKSIQHPSSIIGQQVVLDEGVQIMAGAIIQPRAHIGKNVIINTGTTIDHDTIVGDHSHIAPGAIVCGNVTIGENCFIGAGVTIINGIKIGDNAVIAAGITVRYDVIPNHMIRKEK